MLSRWPLHLLALPLYPALALLAANLGQAGLADAARPLLISLALALLLFLLLRPLLGDAPGAAVLASAAALLALSYGHLYYGLKDLRLLGLEIGRHRFLLPAAALALAAVALVVRRRRPLPRALTGGLNLIAFVLLAMPVAQIAWYGAQTRAAAAEAQGAGAAATPLQLTAPARPPDIYFIVLDTYERADVLRARMDFDNSGFLESLRTMGFAVAPCARANYPGTMTSLAATLNLSHLDELAPELLAARASPYRLAPYIQDSRVVQALQRAGYSIVALETGFSPTELERAEVYFSPSTSVRGRLAGGITPFETLMLRTTLGLFVFSVPPADLPEAVRYGLYNAPYTAHRERILFALDELERMPGRPGPKFVFVHVLAPHDPFVLGPQGEFVERYTPFTLNDDLELRDWETYRTGYLGQLQYLNLRLEAALRRILESSDPAPIVIVQADHGIPRLESPEERLAILSAVHLPGERAGALEELTTPVNTFRIVFDALFGTRLGLLPDDSYRATGERTLGDLERLPAGAFACDPQTAFGAGAPPTQDMP